MDRRRNGHAPETFFEKKTEAKKDIGKEISKLHRPSSKLENKKASEDSRYLDERLAHARTIKDFIASNKATSPKEVLKEVLTNTKVMHRILAGFTTHSEENTLQFDNQKQMHANEPEFNIELGPSSSKILNQALTKEDEKTFISKINRDLELLSKLIVMENGTHYVVFSISRDSKTQKWSLRLQLNHNLFSERSLAQTYPRIPVKEEDLNSFRDIVLEKAQYQSRFSNKAKNFAMITHGSLKSVDNFLEYLNNLIRFNHVSSEERKSAFLINDSAKNDAQLKTKVDSIKEEYSAYGLDLHYLGLEEKQKLIEYYSSLISRFLPNNLLTEEEIEDSVKATLDTDGGAGAQRNWSILLNTICADDDVHPYDQYEDDKKHDYHPVDCWANLLRNLSDEECTYTSYAYSGSSGSSGFEGLLYNIANNKAPYSIDTVNFKKISLSDFYATFFKEPNIDSSDISGSVNAGAHVLKEIEHFPFPAITDANRYLRIEDSMRIILEQYLRVFTSPSKESNIFRQPGASLFHELKEPKEHDKESMKTVLLENISSSFIPSFFAKYFHSVVSELAKETDFLDIEKIFTITAILLKDEFKDSRKLDDEMDYHFKNTEEVCLVFADIMANLTYVSEILFAEDKTALQKDFLEVLEELGLLEFYQNDINDLDINNLDTSKIREILKPELKKYIQVMTIWPYLFYVEKLRKAQ